MARYFCHNCDDLDLKRISIVLDHIWSKHGVEVQKYQTRSAFRCADCEISFKSISLFLRHIDKTHGIHIWYEKGLTRKRVFFDGILDENIASEVEREVERREMAQSQKFLPISKAPFEYEKGILGIEVEGPIVAETKKGNCARCHKPRILVDGNVCKKCHKDGF